MGALESGVIGKQGQAFIPHVKGSPHSAVAVVAVGQSPHIPVAGAL